MCPSHPCSKYKPRKMNVTKDYCPVTGLTITQKPEWSDIGFGGDYRIRICLLGEQIILAKSVG